MAYDGGMAAPDLSGLAPPTDKWTIEPYDPERDAPPPDHHHQGDDPPDPED